MQQFGVKELKATPGGGLRVQANGGKEALEIRGSPVLDDYEGLTVKMTYALNCDNTASVHDRYLSRLSYERE